MNFSIYNKHIYLDTARSSGLYQELLEWRNNHDKKLYESGSQFRDNNDLFIKNLKNSISSFFHTEQSSVYLTQSFSSGFKSLLSILNPNLKFLLINNDYPSIIQQVKINGFDYKLINNDYNIEQLILESIETSKPQVLVLSIVQYIDGLLINLEFLKIIKKKFPELLIIADGTQFCGTTDFNFENSAIDVLVSSGYKWLYSGYGNGLILIKRKFVQNFVKKKIMVMDNSSFISAFEPGNIDTLNFGSLLFSINLISKIGIGNVEKTIKKLSNYAKERFTSSDLLEKKILNRKEHSNIFNLKGNDLLHKKLIKNNIICSKRGNGIRVSFSFLNKKKEIDMLMKYFN